MMLGKCGMLVYVLFMTERLIELQRVLKPTGSLYLHCDPTASHYLKLAMDAVFGSAMFRNEVVWRRAISHNDARRIGRISDRIFFYTKSDKFIWNGDAVRTP
ncbi:adenine specific DNA methylase Mod [SAR116 cluster alpha proteobacterium HIMB100]|nr:adenine specific DNA methylase Mod [SAR116 cluster alpha proteobacterium HIMB100]